MHTGIRGSEEQRLAARKLIDESLELISQEEKFPIAQEEHFRLIGPGGRTVRRLEQESGKILCWWMLLCPQREKE